MHKWGTGGQFIAYGGIHNTYRDFAGDFTMRERRTGEVATDLSCRWKAELGIAGKTGRTLKPAYPAVVGIRCQINTFSVT